ncbi:unnamed protein product [Cochlearia groenlandica]
MDRMATCSMRKKSVRRVSTVIMIRSSQIQMMEKCFCCGGEYRFIEANPRELFAALTNQRPLSMYGQKSKSEEDAEIEESDESESEEKTEISYEKAARVEKTVANFVDEKEVDEYASLIDLDDDDDDDDDGEGYVRYVSVRGELKLRQVFDSC